MKTRIISLMCIVIPLASCSETNPPGEGPTQSVVEKALNDSISLDDDVFTAFTKGPSGSEPRA